MLVQSNGMAQALETAPGWPDPKRLSASIKA